MNVFRSTPDNCAVSSEKLATFRGMTNLAGPVAQLRERGLSPSPRLQVRGEPAVSVVHVGSIDPIPIVALTGCKQQELPRVRVSPGIATSQETSNSCKQSLEATLRSSSPEALLMDAEATLKTQELELTQRLNADDAALEDLVVVTQYPGTYQQRRPKTKVNLDREASPGSGGHPDDELARPVPSETLCDDLPRTFDQFGKVPERRLQNMSLQSVDISTLSLETRRTLGEMSFWDQFASGVFAGLGGDGESDSPQRQGSSRAASDRPRVPCLPPGPRLARRTPQFYSGSWTPRKKRADALAFSPSLHVRSIDRFLVKADRALWSCSPTPS